MQTPCSNLEQRVGKPRAAEKLYKLDGAYEDWQAQNVTRLPGKNWRALNGTAYQRFAQISDTQRDTVQHNRKGCKARPTQWFRFCMLRPLTLNSSVGKALGSESQAGEFNFCKGIEVFLIWFPMGITLFGVGFRCQKTAEIKLIPLKLTIWQYSYAGFPRWIWSNSNALHACAFSAVDDSEWLHAQEDNNKKNAPLP